MLVSTSEFISKSKEYKNNMQKYLYFFTLVTTGNRILNHHHLQ